MTDKEKIQKFETLEELKKTVGGWFGSADLIFAGHPLDEQRAKEALKLAAKNNISLEEIEDIATVFLVRKGCIKEHYDEQLKRITKFFRKKLS